MVATICVPVPHEGATLMPCNVWLGSWELSADAWFVRIDCLVGDGVVELNQIVGLLDE